MPSHTPSPWSPFSVDMGLSPQNIKNPRLLRMPHAKLHHLFNVHGRWGRAPIWAQLQAANWKLWGRDWGWPWLPFSVHIHQPCPASSAPEGRKQGGRGKTLCRHWPIPHLVLPSGSPLFLSQGLINGAQILHTQGGSLGHSCPSAASAILPKSKP